jgi:glycopeptide antibiotics resistance protein
MKEVVKKILVLLPVILLTLLYLKDHYREEYRHAGARRLILFALTLLLLYAWFFYSAYRWKQENAIAILVQSSFFIYIFMVLTLTGYFILFREISTHGWATNMRIRIRHEDHVNLTPLKIFKIYEPGDKQIVGNLVMLFPLGIYLPILYKRLNNFFLVLLVSLLVSVLIELFQLATRFRSADVDDVILNTTGAIVGFLVFRLVCLFRPSGKTNKPGIL